MSSSTADPASRKALLPGFGRPVNFVPTPGDPDYIDTLFPNALTPSDMEAGSTRLNPLTVRELVMLRFMNTITDKPEWYMKVNNAEISDKWKQEGMSSEIEMTQKMADYCIAELRHKSTKYTADNRLPVIVYPGSVVKSDVAVSRELQLELKAAVGAFEDAIPERKRDWHPGSNEMVWDIVHPSLFPLVYGQTKVLEGEIATLEDCIDRCGQGAVVAIPSDDEVKDPTPRNFWSTFSLDHPFSKKFQWLPCEVNISGEHTKITSYINNLHPKERKLYDLAAKLIEASIPLWNITLAPLVRGGHSYDRRIPYDAVEYDPDPQELAETEGPQIREGESEDDHWDRQDEWIRMKRRELLVFPEPEDFSPLKEPEPLDLRIKFGSRGLQVIVKLANIQLTPEKPKYGGGTWHVEGQLNEHIVATSLYYYSSENITTSTLSFRQQCEVDLVEEINYEQNDNDWIEDIFGCQQDGPAIQELGSVDTKEGRLLTFPNILQHRVGPFELADSSKPGHRKIVALFLVDPNIKVISTANVPCQRQEWWWEKVMAGENSHASSNKIHPAIDQVPIELQEGILKDVDFPFNLEKAKELRLQLMDERKAFVARAQNEFVNQRTFSLCEH